jgi:hypothetical protein
MPGILTDAHAFVTVFPTWRALTQDNCGYFARAAKARIFRAFLGFIVAYSNNAALWLVAAQDYASFAHSFLSERTF